MSKLINVMSAKKLSTISLSVSLIGKVMPDKTTKTLKKIEEITIKKGKDIYWLNCHGFNAPIDKIVHMGENDYKLCFTKSGQEFSKCLGIKFRLDENDVYSIFPEVQTEDLEYQPMLATELIELLIPLKGKQITQTRLDEWTKLTQS